MAPASHLNSTPSLAFASRPRSRRSTLQLDGRGQNPGAVAGGKLVKNRAPLCIAIPVVPAQEGIIELEDVVSLQLEDF